MRTTTLATRLAAVGAVLATGVIGLGPIAADARSGPADARLDVPAAAPGARDLTGLKVLLTNDDSAQGRDVGFGTDGKGLYELRKALCAAGADVLVVAPWSQQSGAGARMATPGFAPVAITVQAVTPPAAYVGDCASSSTGGAVFGVCVTVNVCGSGSPSGSPADAVHIALSRFAANYWSGGPDVVLSGVNFGQNMGATLNHSGTVGAVVTAHEYGVPAIALSAEVPRSLPDIPRVPFAATAEFGVRLLAELVGRGRLGDGLVLNANYPFVGAGEELGNPVLTVAGETSDVGMTFIDEVGRTGGTYRLVPGDVPVETRRDADTTALAANDIPVTVLDGDWSMSSRRPGIEAVVRALR